METAMTKSKITTTTLAALAFAGALAVTSGTAEAHSHWGAGVGIGIAAGALIGAAAATNAYGGPVYVTPAYRECRLVERYDRWGNLRVVQVCGY
jgi:anaerobic C4-dicarboxylate transporter